jgi:hypothetical protein
LIKLGFLLKNGFVTTGIVRQSWFQKWEHRIFINKYDKKKRIATWVGMEDLTQSHIELLDNLGQEGGELAAMTTIEVEDSIFFHFVMKRPISE